MVGLIVTAENEMRKVEYDSPHYNVIRKAVGGRYEHVRPAGLERPYCMMVNEEGLLLGLPLNLLGSWLYGMDQHGQPIVKALHPYRQETSTARHIFSKNKVQGTKLIYVLSPHLSFRESYPKMYWPFARHRI